MTFEQFIDKCLSALTNTPKEKLYFQYTYYPDTPSVGNSYKCQIKGTKYKVYITPNQDVCQYYDEKDNFINLNSLSECLIKMKNKERALNG